MNKNLLNIKNLLKIIISILVIFSMLKSCSMAYTYEQFEQFINACYDNNITTSAMSIYNLEFAKNNMYKITDYINNNNIDVSNCISFALRMNGLSYMEIWFFPRNPDFGATSGGSPFVDLRPKNSGNFYINTNGSLVNVNNSWYDSFRCGIFQNEPLNSSFSNFLFQGKWDPHDHPLTPPFNFTPYNITTIDDYNILKFAYVGNVILGELGDNEYYQLEVRLKDSSLTTLGTAIFNENQECLYRDNALLVENNRIIANSVYLSYYEPYYLEFTIWRDSSNYEINGHLYKFYPQNAVIENGQIVSPGSGDYTNQNQTINIIGGVVGELPSGDSPGSGILGGIASLFIPSSDFFLNYFNNLNNWLTDHLGFLYAPFSIVFDLLNRIIAVDFSDPMVEFGPFTIPLNDDIPLVGHYEYHFNDLLDDSNLAQIHDIYLVIIDGILILGFLYMLYCKYEEIIGGKKE